MPSPDVVEVSIVAEVDGEVHPCVTLKGRAVDRLAGLSLIYKDLMVANEMFRLTDPSLKKRCVQDQALLLAAVSTYTKAFTSADGRATSLDAKHVFKETPDLLRSHHELMELRNSYVAHGGLSLNEQIQIFAILSPDEKNKKILGISGQILYLGQISGADKAAFLEVVAHVLKHVQSKIEGANKHVAQKPHEIPINSLYEALKEDDVGT